MSLISKSSSRLVVSRLASASAVSRVRWLSQAPAAAAVATLRRSSELEGLSYLELNRPQAKNALSVELVDRLRQLVEDVRFDGSVVSASRHRACPT